MAAGRRPLNSSRVTAKGLTTQRWKARLSASAQQRHAQPHRQGGADMVEVDAGNAGDGRRDRVR
jgi:hypothetical protein